MSRRVAVIGGGISGLAAAHALTDGLEVHLLEATSVTGGKLRTSPFAGRPAIDEGPDAFLARLPWGTALAKAVGLGDTLVSPASGSAAVWFDQLHPIPQGLLLGMPTDVMALSRSHLLTWGGKIRAAFEPFLRRTSVDPDSLGGYVRSRFGDQVHERLVDPLVGSIYAADTDHFSLAAVPQIFDLASRSRSVLIAGRRMPKPSAAAGPVFYAPQHGMGAMAAAVHAAVVDAGGSVHTNHIVAELAADGNGWRVDGERFDAVVLASPAAATAELLHSVAPDSAAIVRSITAADVVMVTLSVPASSWPARLTGMSGYLVPKPAQRLVTAVSFGSQKWSHWAADDSIVLRISLGRDGLPVLHLRDDELLAAAVSETSLHLGVDLAPNQFRITRWQGAFPQYRPQHAQRVQRAEAALPAGISLCGASFHGIGVPACIRSAQSAAGVTRQHLASLAG